MSAADDSALHELAREVGARLQARGEQLATAESCTGGWIGKVLTDVAGSSAWFGWGVVSYANEAKAALLGVAPELIERHGAVSREVVIAMAEGALRSSGAQHALAVSGIAGPGGEMPGKPVGTVWFAWQRAGQAQSSAECCRFPGDREDVRRATVRHALVHLLERLGDASDSD
ncbi:MAG: CinA family protein [Gammaproteobacteria bacterium]|nr:CinA family protein [Gammaproteobacteria bacterium]